jgi:hypothetical protein
MSRSVNICPPPKMFWDLKYGAPRTADLIIFLAIMIAIWVSDGVGRFDTGEWCNIAGV